MGEIKGTVLYSDISGPEEWLDVFYEDKLVEVDPCPFCGSRSFLNSEPKGIFAHCSVCKAESAKFSNGWDAVKAWNRRAGKDYFTGSKKAIPKNKEKEKLEKLRKKAEDALFKLTGEHIQPD